MVSVSLASTPTGAEVMIDGESRGVTPTTIVLERGADPVDVELHAEGHLVTTERLIPDVDQRLRVTLEEEPPPIVPEAREEETPDPAPTPRMRRRTRMRGMGSAMSSDRGFRRWD